jgi:AraC-like DNA-binding protein
MRSRLNWIMDWKGLAGASRFCVKELSRQCGISVRQLERYFDQRMNQSPARWLSQLRQEQALRIIASGATMKEAANSLGYKHATHFSRAFKRHHGVPPTRARSLTSKKRL